MMIYIDSEYKCHITNDGTRRAFEVSFFNGKCAEFIEGYRYIPSSEPWARPDGVVFTGEMIAPWKDYNQLYKAQLEYEVTQYEASLSEIETALGVTS